MDQNKHQAVAETVAKRKKKEQFSLRKAAKNLSVQGIKELVQSVDKRKVDVGPGHVVKRSQESGSTPPVSQYQAQQEPRGVSAEVKSPAIAASPSPRSGLPSPLKRKGFHGFPPAHSGPCKSFVQLGEFVLVLGGRSGWMVFGDV